MKAQLSSLLRRVFPLLTSPKVRHELRRAIATLTQWMPRRRALPSRLHLGCGGRHVDGWLNVDVSGSDWNVDLSRGRLPWPDRAFQAVATQHFVEHLHLDSELIPLLREVFRVTAPDGEVWISTPDISKIVDSYQNHRMSDLVVSRQRRFPNWDLGGAPDVQMMNELFHQHGSHKNLFDLELLTWALQQAGFADVEPADEPMMLTRFPEFPKRDDGEQTLYVVARPSLR